MRWARALLLPVLAVAVVACGGGGPAASDGGNGGDQSDTPDATATATADDGNGNGGPDGNGGDLDQLAEDLTPPNSSETSRTTAGGVIFVTFESSDSPDSLRDFYEDAIAQTGLEVFSTTSAQGSYSWIFAESEGSSYGGVVTVVPSGTGSGSGVAIQIGTGD